MKRSAMEVVEAGWGLAVAGLGWAEVEAQDLVAA
jgi:hypothetical protein